MANGNGRVKLIGIAVPTLTCVVMVFWYLAGIKSDVAVLQTQMTTLNGSITTKMDDRFRRQDWDKELGKLDKRFEEIKDRIVRLEGGK